MEILISQDDITKTLYHRHIVDIPKGLTVLVGRNGAGKSTFISYAKEYLEKNNIPVFSYDNYSDGGSNAISSYGFYGDVEGMVNTLFHSEGEQIYYNFSKQCKLLGNFIQKNKNADNIFVLFDAIDSGFDIEGMTELQTVFRTICRYNPNLHLVVSTNNYELADGNQCYDVAESRYITFENYQEYKKFILQKYKKN